MNTYQLVIPTTTIAVPNVSILGTQDMNPSITHSAVPVNYHTTYYTNCTRYN
jgi:hypothetical protein